MWMLNQDLNAHMSLMNMFVQILEDLVPIQGNTQYCASLYQLILGEIQVHKCLTGKAIIEWGEAHHKILFQQDERTKALKKLVIKIDNLECTLLKVSHNMGVDVAPWTQLGQSLNSLVTISSDSPSNVGLFIPPFISKRQYEF